MFGNFMESIAPYIDIALKCFSGGHDIRIIITFHSKHNIDRIVAVNILNQATIIASIFLSDTFDEQGG